jgi:hypothetical protein
VRGEEKYDAQHFQPIQNQLSPRRWLFTHHSNSLMSFLKFSLNVSKPDSVSIPSTRSWNMTPLDGGGKSACKYLNATDAGLPSNGKLLSRMQNIAMGLVSILAKN